MEVARKRGTGALATSRGELYCCGIKAHPVAQFAAQRLLTSATEGETRHIGLRDNSEAMAGHQC